jgi:hypothetical protein
MPVVDRRGVKTTPYGCSCKVRGPAALLEHRLSLLGLMMLLEKPVTPKTPTNRKEAGFSGLSKE